MNKAAQQFINDLQSFTRESLNWCQEESEKSVSSINNTIAFLLKNSNRITEMSAETLKVLEEVADRASKLKPPQGQKISPIVELLQDVQKTHNEAHRLLSPIIQALQFHDRICQKMNNFQKILDAWKINRASLSVAEANDEATLFKFGKEIMKHTTMREERDIIRGIIPNLPNDELDEDQNAIMF